MKYDECKHSPDAHGRLRYRLRRATVWVTDFGFHHTAHIDPAPAEIEGPGDAAFKKGLRDYLEGRLQYNRARYAREVELVEAACGAPLCALRVLDVGCGGGLFLSLLQQRGADVMGLEVEPRRAEYARATHNIRVENRPIEHPEIQTKYWRDFDAVTLWDVIEHVNFPQNTLMKAQNLLKPGGRLLISTPCRDAFYHRVGALSYAVSGGRWPTFLNAMYSDDDFGHKQIFSMWEMRDILALAGFVPEHIEKRHELSLPYAAYLAKMVKSRALADALAPLAKVFFRVVRIRNKMIVVGRKVPETSLSVGLAAPGG